MQRLHFIDPGKPTQNAFVESLNGKFREECLSQNWFTSLDHARREVAEWRTDYNETRPHKSLGWRTPAEVERAALDSPEGLSQESEINLDKNPRTQTTTTSPGISS